MNRRNYRFRLYPTKEIEQKFVETLDGCRWVYNYFFRIEMSKYDMQFALTELKEQKPWLHNYHSKMLQMVTHKVDAARKALSVLRNNGHRVGKLHYLTHEEYNSFTYNQSGFRIDGDKLHLSKIGSVRIVLHRRLANNIKQVTVVRQNDKWYAVIACETAKPIFRFINPRKFIGIDMGITKFAHDSDNHEVENPLFLKKMLKPLKRAQQKVSRRIKGSNNHAKAKSWVASLYGRIARKRMDFLHKTSRYYADRYDIIFLERLRTLNMVKNHRLARHVLDSGWSTFKQILEYKAKMVVEVEPYNTSVLCSKCGQKVPKKLAVRIHRCYKCGLMLDRDYNASLNILQRGLSYLPAECREVTPVEIPVWSLGSRKPLPSGQGNSPVSTKD
jgi:putative transposase